ncbi:MAG: 30S ribosomal protein S6 [Gammaproteobacteria bacterium WSBS_2016_MAG_OTU1]
MNIECGNDTLDKLREIFRFSDFILRSLIIRREQAVTEPSVIMAEKHKKQSEGDSSESDAHKSKKSTKTENAAAGSSKATDSADVATEATLPRNLPKMLLNLIKLQQKAKKRRMTSRLKPAAKEVKAEDSAATDSAQANQETQAEVKAEDSATTDETAAPASDDSQSKETDK